MIEFLLASAVVAIAAILQATTGLGFAILSVPLLALVDVAYVPGPTMLAALFLSAIMVAREGRAIAPREIGMLAPALVAGTVVGAALMAAVPVDTIGLVIGGGILAAVAVAAACPPLPVTRTNLWLAGTGAGVMGTVAGMHGPALAVLYQGGDIARTRATLALVFIVACSISLAGLYAAGRFDGEGVVRGLSLLPGLVGGYLIAGGVRHLVPQRALRPIILGLAAASALVLLVRSL